MKKRENGAWAIVPYSEYKQNEVETTSFPLNFYAKGDNIPDWTLSGNCYQGSTPTPTNPVAVEECGDKTENLLETLTVGYTLSQQGLPQQYISGDGMSRMVTLMPIDVSDFSAVTFSYQSTTTDDIKFMYSLFSGNTLLERISGKKSGYTIDTSLADSLYICMYIADTSVSVKAITYDIMLNSGSTTLPYEPYGYKIPISTAGTTTNLYLSEPLRKIGNYADTVNSESVMMRKIKKMVLDGTENWQSVDTGYFYLNRMSPDYLRAKDVITVISSHYGSYKQIGDASEVPNGCCSLRYGTNNQRLYITDTAYSTAEDFKTFLAAQYANGTPVTVWYVLATPTTELITPVSIPTAAGTNTLDVSTTLKPSKFEANLGKMFVPVGQEKVRVNGNWV